MGIQDVAVVRMPSSVPNNGRTIIMESADSSFETMDWLKAWAENINEQVHAGKNVMVFYQFRNDDRYKRWPSMKQILEIVCKVGGIDMATDTVMQYGGMDGHEKKRILSDINTH
jgi:hypothetical protein